MAQPIFSAESYHIYDPYFGFYVKKLTADSTTPFLKKNGWSNMEAGLRGS